MKRFSMWSAVPAALLLAACLQAPAQNPSPVTNFPEGELNVLTETEKADGWELLFNGENLDGWVRDEGRHRGEWRVENGVIISEKGASHLFSEKTYKNIDLQWNICAYDAAVPKMRFGNSGVFVRCQKTGGAFPRGYEVQVDPYDVRNPTGGVYGHATGNLLVDQDGNWKPEAFFQVHEGKWMHQRVRIVEDRIQVWVNGEMTLDWKDPEKTFMDAGYIALQNHHASDVVLFTNIKIKALD